MKIMVLDDDKARHKRFKTNLIGKLVTHVYTVEEAREALLKETFDVVYLDHDLNDHESSSLDYSSTYGGPREMTGVDVALAVAKLPPDRMPQLAIVHSFNPEGANNIVSVLKGKVPQVVKQPFHETIGLDLRVW